MAKKSAPAARQPKIDDKVYVGEAYSNPNDNIGKISKFDQDSSMFTVSGTTTNVLDGSEVKWNYQYALLAFFTARWDEVEQRWNMQDVAPM